MEVAPERQAIIFQIMEDFLEKWTTFDLLYKRITLQERETMFQWLDKLREMLNLPKPKETVKMAHVGTIVQKNSDKTIPEEFVDLAAGTNDGYIGYAFAEDGELRHGNLPGGEVDSLNTIKETMTDGVAMPMTFMFGKGADSDDSVQPFNTLQDAKGDCICATFIEGDLQGFDAPESSHSIEHNAHQSYLAPKLIDIFRLCGEDLTQVCEKLGSSNTKREILATCFPTTTARGEILLVFANGQKVSLVKGDKHQKYDWGEVSQAMGYEGKPVVDTKPEKKSLLGKKLDVKKPEDKKVVDTAISAAMAKAEEAKKAPETGLDVMIIPPATRFESFKSLNDWYKGFSHPDHMPDQSSIEGMVKKAHTAIPVMVKATMTNAALNHLLSKNLVLLPPAGTSKDNKSAKTEAKITPAIIPAADRDTFNKQIMPKIVKAIQAYDDGSRLIIPADRVADFLKDKPLATEQLGIQEGLSQFWNWSDVAFEQLATKLPMVAGTLLQQFALEHMTQSMALQAASKIKKAM